MMINKNFFWVIIFFISNALFAQNKPAEAVAIVEKSAQKYNALSAFSLDFTVIINKNEKTLQNFKGVLFVKKEKYFLSYQEQTIANDEKMMWNYQKETNEVTFFEADEGDFSMFHPAKMLSNWEAEYNAKFIREEELQKKQVYVMDLTPKKKSSFYKMRLFIDKTTFYIQQAMMYEFDGSIITYIVTKFTPNATISDAKFTFNPNDYSNVQIIDMR